MYVVLMSVYLEYFAVLFKDFLIYNKKAIMYTTVTFNSLLPFQEITGSSNILCLKSLYFPLVSQ